MQDRARLTPQWETPTALYRPAARAYEIDERLDAFVDSVVLTCREHRDSLDDTVDTVTSLVRTVAPSDIPETDPEWEARWRAYFEFSDHAIMHAIRAYVENAVSTTTL